jgi:hypothetical protein
VSIILYHERFCTAQCYNFHSEDEVQLDLLEKPLTSYEIQKLAYLLTKLSQLLNHVLGLPSARQTVTWSWQTVWDHLVGAADESQGARQGERGARVGMLGWFRFNLRIFASHTAVSIYAIALFAYFGLPAIVILPALYVLVWVAYFLFGPSWVDQFGFVGVLKIFHYDEDSERVRLNDNEREEILRGTRAVDKQRIKYLGDPLDLPYFSYECESLVDYLVKLSKQLNEKYQLPKEEQTATWSSLRMVQFAVKNRNRENPFKFCYRCFRFNLRFLACVQQVGMFVGLSTAAMLYWRWIGLIGGLIGGSLTFVLYHICPEL